MSASVHDIPEILKRYLATIPLIDKTDFTQLAQIMTDLEAMTATSGVPQAFKTLAKRAAQLVEHIIMSETDFAGGLKKLGTSIKKMLDAAKTLSTSETNNGVSEMAELKTGKKAAGKTNSDAINDSDRCRQEAANNEMNDLMVKFAANQQSVFEDFEAYILEMEKGNPPAKSAIKRILHTWKGEFGVLSLQEYSKLIHSVEDLLETDAFPPDNLFRLKDLLVTKLSGFAAGENPVLSEIELLEIFANVKTNHFELPATGKTPESKQLEPTQAEVKPDDPLSGEQALNADASVVSDFITESRDHLHSAETFLLELETNPTIKENIDTIFRAWHTIKGVSAFLGLVAVNKFAHTMENLMEKVRKGELVLDPPRIDLLLEANDCLKEFIVRIEGALSSGKYTVPDNYQSIITKLHRALENSSFTPSEETPPPDKKLGEILIEKGTATPQSVQKALDLQANGDTRKLGEILIDENKVPSRDVGSALAVQATSRQASVIEETIRVPVNRIDILIDAIGEAAIAQSMIMANQTIRDIEDQTLHTKISHSNMIMHQIQEMAMSLRMVSIKSTFQKMVRLARDLGKKCGKEIDLVSEGEDTELDKSVVENIGDPLIHMIRNSVDHGVEPKEDRIAAGKPVKATIKLRAYHRAGSIFIEVSDDGKGLDREAILQKAISKGLCKPEAHLTDEEVYQFIFLPGFSTAKQITDVSGRGVGMDVVRRNIENLRGSVEITSTPGKGTTFNIRLPLTLAIVDGMIVRAGDDKYIIPTLSILESLKPEKGQIEAVMNKGKYIKVRGELITITHLESLFSNNGHAWNLEEGIVIIVEDLLGKKMGVHVDEIVGQQQVVVKSLGTGIGDIPGVTGGAIMSDGNVSLILDVGGIQKLAIGN